MKDVPPAGNARKKRGPHGSDNSPTVVEKVGAGDEDTKDNTVDTKPFPKDSDSTNLYDPGTDLFVAEPTPRPPTPTNVEVRSDQFSLEPGTMLGDYRIQGRLGEGGWATVFSAIHPLIGKRAAVKVLKKELCRHPAAVQRFIDEARAVNQIGHPNIVDVFTFGETLGGRSYFVMEWLKGETLLARLRRGPLKLREICAIVIPLARALNAAHEHGVIHRDLKPENVFLVDVRGEEPHVKLLDFGIAKLASNEWRQDKTSTGEIVGTPVYMAPEQARGRHIDHRVDIYALGGILFEMVAGRTPFVADNAADLIASHLTEPPPRPSRFATNVSPELDNLVVAMLAKKADKRPSLSHVCSVLDKLRSGGATAGEMIVRSPERSPDRSPDRSRSTAPKKARQPDLRRSTWSTVAGAARATTQMVRPRNPRKWLLGAGVLLAAVIATFAVVVTIKGSSRSEPESPKTVGTLVLAVSGAPYFQVAVDERTVVPKENGEISLPPGTHTVEVSAPGMRHEAFLVVITAGGVLRESVDLQPLRPPDRPK